MVAVLTDPDLASPDWLTDALRGAGVLQRGHVTNVQRAAVERTSTWALHHLNVRYSPDATATSHGASTPTALPSAWGAGTPGGPPARLVLKISLNAALAPDAAPHHGLSTGKEVWFYRNVATEAAMRAVPLIRCYAAVHEPPYGASHALVDDLSATHGQPPLLLPPTQEQCAQAVEALARLHAAWWEHPRLAPGGDIPARLAWEREAAHAIGWQEPMETVVPAFVAYLGDRLASEQRQVYERLLASESTRHERRQRRPQTLRHGDAHWWNFLYPQNAAHRSAVDTTRLLDWGSWRTGIATDDLAYLIALHGSRPWRRRFEQDLLRRYHGALMAAAVGDYDWRACWDDYRASVVESLFVVPRFWSINVPAYIWWAKLECGFAAFEDLACAELLDG